MLQFVRQFLEKGNSVVATARTPSKATELQKLAEKHSRLMLTEVDVTSMDSIKVAYAGAPYACCWSFAVLAGIFVRDCPLQALSGCPAVLTQGVALSP